MLHGAKSPESSSISPVSPPKDVALLPVGHKKSERMAQRRFHQHRNPSPADPREQGVKHDELSGLRPSEPIELNASWIAGLVPLITELVNQQRNASATRSHLREVRTALRHRRDEVAEHLAMFMKRVQPLVSNEEFDARSIDKGAIAVGCEALQTANQEYLEMEDTYHWAEDRLGAEEHMLSKTMERLARFAQGAKLPAYQDDELLKPVVDDLISDDSSSYDSTPMDLPAGIREYLSRIGDVQILQERLHNLDIQRASIIERQEQRNTFHIPLDSESREFLEGYEEERKKTWQDLNQAHLDAAELERICEDSGILTDDYKNRLDYLYQFDIIYQRSEIGNVDIFNHVDDPLKLPTGDLETKEQPFFYKAPPNSPDVAPCLSGRFNAPEVGKVWFYNRWTWHQVCISTYQIHLLMGQSEFQKRLDEGMDETALGELAEAEWFKDNPTPLTKTISEEGESLRDDGPTGYWE